MKLNVGCSYKFRALRRGQSSNDLLFQHSLYEAIQKVVPIPGNTTTGYQKIEDLIGGVKGTFHYKKLLCKVVQIREKEINSKPIVEVVLADTLYSTTLTLWKEQTKFKSRFIVGQVVFISNFLINDYPKSSLPKHITYDKMNRTQVVKVEDPALLAQFESVSLDDFEQVLEGILDQFWDPWFYRCCSRCNKKMQPGEPRCSNSCPPSASAKETFDFKCSLVIETSEDTFQYVVCFGNMLRRFENDNVDLGEDTDLMPNLLPAKFDKILGKKVRATVKLEGSNKLLQKLELA